MNGDFRRGAPTCMRVNLSHNPLTPSPSPTPGRGEQENPVPLLPTEGEGVRG